MDSVSTKQDGRSELDALLGFDYVEADDEEVETNVTDLQAWVESANRTVR